MSDWAATLRMPAEILLSEQTVLRGELHLQARVAVHDGAETPLEMLNRPDPFFPLSLPEGGVVFVAKDQVACVNCPAETALSEPERLGAARVVRLGVVLVGGVEWAGWAALELPPTHARALDYLNSSGPFFTLRSDDATRYVHRRHVRLARPLD